MYYFCDQFGFNDDLLIKESAAQECDATEVFIEAMQLGTKKIIKN
jgi:hypothetical protein